MQLFLTLFVGVFAGWLLDRGHLRLVLITGIAFEVFGMMMTSLCTSYWQLLLAQGICVGIGSGMLAFTSAAIIPFYFTKRRMLAAGIVSTGSSIGKECTVQIISGWLTGDDSGSRIPTNDARTLRPGRFRLGCPDISVRHARWTLGESCYLETTYQCEEGKSTGEE